MASSIVTDEFKIMFKYFYYLLLPGGIVGVRKISVSIPEELLKRLDEFAKAEGLSRSKVIAYAVEAYLSRYRAKVEEIKGYPTVLWKLKAIGGIKLRSPRRVGRRIKGEWVVEEF